LNQSTELPIKGRMDWFDLFGAFLPPDLSTGRGRGGSPLLDLLGLLLVPVVAGFLFVAFHMEALGLASLLLLVGGGVVFVYWLSRRAGDELGPTLMRSIGCAFTTLCVILGLVVLQTFGSLWAGF
jgi:hypothetical protein